MHYSLGLGRERLGLRLTPAWRLARRGLIVTSAAAVALVVSGGIFTFTPLVGLSVAHTSGISMEPQHKEGDPVLLRQVEQDDLEVGDVVVFKAFGRRIMHRIIEKRPGDEGEFILVTQGDNLPRPDSPIQASQVSSELVGEIPLLGWFSRLIGAKGGLYVYRSIVLAMALSAVVVWGLRESTRRDARRAHALFASPAPLDSATQEKSEETKETQS